MEFFDVGLSIDPLDTPKFTPPGDRSIGNPCLKVNFIKMVLNFHSDNARIERPNILSPEYESSKSRRNFVNKFIKSDLDF